MPWDVALHFVSLKILRLDFFFLNDFKKSISGLLHFWNFLLKIKLGTRSSRAISLHLGVCICQLTFLKCHFLFLFCRRYLFLAKPGLGTKHSQGLVTREPYAWKLRKGLGEKRWFSHCYQHFSAI